MKRRKHIFLLVIYIVSIIAFGYLLFSDEMNPLSEPMNFKADKSSRIAAYDLAYQWADGKDYPNDEMKQYYDSEEVTPPRRKEKRALNATAEELYRKVKVLCMVVTMPRNHEVRATAVKETWGSRCNKLIFFSTEEDKSLGAIAINVTEDKKYLWRKVKEGFKYAWETYKDEMDWFLKTDDDTYIIVENLRYMLNAYDTNDPMWFGYRFKKFTIQGYMSGGGGYLLSKEAMRRFVDVALPNSTLCKSADAGAEDAEMGKCLDKVGVVIVDSRDEKERERFHPFVPPHHLVPGAMGNVPWYWDYAYYQPKIGLDCCSDTAISFHYMAPNKMRELHYFTYNLIPYGILPPRLPKLAPTLESVAELLKNRSKRP